MRIKHYYGMKREYEILDKVTDRQKELIDIYFLRDLSHTFNITKYKSFDDYSLLTIDHFKEFVFSEEMVLLPDENKIYPTQLLIHKYPESFGEYGENLEIYEDREIKDISKIYFPNIKYIRLFKKDYLKDLLVIKIKDNKIIDSINIEEKYLSYIKRMLEIEKLDYQFSEFVHRNRGIYTFYNLEIDKLLLDIAANLDCVYSHYLKNPLSTWSTQSLGDVTKYFPKIMDRLDEQVLESEDKHIELGVFLKEAITNNDFRVETLASYNIRKRYKTEIAGDKYISKEVEGTV